MRLYIMRHGHAADSSPSGRDADRPLTDDGRRLVERVGALLLSHHGAQLPQIHSSTYLRAMQTAEIMARTIAAPGVVFDTHDELEPDEPIPMSMLRKLAEAGGDALLVGHHPMVIAMSRLLARDSSKLPLGLHPGMLVGLERPTRDSSPSSVEGSFHVTTVLAP
ncbi:MAG TPA: histidine phosphatase family protein [Polyangium sp.]|nr:histidine phosphatase family protein [Polyangium sp.]